MLAKWEPFGGLRQQRGNIFNELSTMQQEMNRMFEDFFGEQRSRLDEGTWLPAVDMSEDESEFVVHAELPGMSKDDIDINIEDNCLILSGEKEQEKKGEGENYHSMERSYGKFKRSFTLPTGIKADDVQATFQDGVLKVHLPKAEEAKPKKISVSVGS